jgi:uncharacterized protein
MKVAVTGATGLVGRRLVERLLAAGHQVVALVRDPDKAARLFSSQSNLEIVAYSPTDRSPDSCSETDWKQAIAGCDGVVNLAGEPIAEKRWTPEQKQEILTSRQRGTEQLVAAIAQANPKPSVLVNASAIGFYGTSETARFDEASPAGDDFLAQICTAWEAEAQKVTQSGVRLVILRIGVVLGPGGALAKMLPAFKLFAGGPLGTGKQWFSWIHRDDLVNLILLALTRSDLSGTFNATAPQPVRMAELSIALGQVLGRPSWLPVPAFALEALLGDGAKVVLEGQQVLPQRTQTTGFEYQYPTVKQALEEVVSQGG